MISRILSVLIMTHVSATKIFTNYSYVHKMSLMLLPLNIIAFSDTVMLCLYEQRWVCSQCICSVIYKTPWPSRALTVWHIKSHAVPSRSVYLYNSVRNIVYRMTELVSANVPLVWRPHTSGPIIPRKCHIQSLLGHFTLFVMHYSDLLLTFTFVYLNLGILLGVKILLS